MISSSPTSLHARLLLRGAAFTLIELLVVISIIAVLAGLLLPVVSKVMENARKVSAKSSVTQIVAAVNNYQTDYGQYPVETTAGATPVDKTFGTDNHNYLLFNVLRALNSSGSGDPTYQTLNSRRIVYFEGKNVKNPTTPKDGFVATDGGKTTYSQTTLTQGDLLDPWGNVYLIRIDTGYSNALVTPYAGGADDTGIPQNDPSLLHLSTIAYSFGPDGQIGTRGTKATASTGYTDIGDDVLSWQ